MKEYKLVDIEIDPNEIMMAGVNLEVKQRLNAKVQDKINEMVKEGWDLHSSGIAAVPLLLFFREKPKTRRK